MKLLLMLGFFFVSMTLFGQNNDRIYYLNFELLSKSTIEFKGRSTINTFSCGSALLKGKGAYLVDGNAAESIYYGDISVEVNSLDCGSGLMNADMYKTLKQENYPIIDFRLVKIHKVEYLDSLKQNFNADVEGVLTVAGRSKSMVINFNIVELSDSTFFVTGSKSLSMLDFGIDPPSKFFGLIQVDNSLKVEFNLFFKMKKQTVLLSQSLKNIRQSDFLIIFR